ncbi:uncharacterized protein LOC116189003 [Punica granatum]|uniref:Uncharacterized protein LOC116189003 n=1 Tax=Punica granatum TaxID=22663 RepID=A0A6P8BVI9_PUNGR|nr:uncharacterized protein LOC116189003 [Punica granatum]
MHSMRRQKRAAAATLSMWTPPILPVSQTLMLPTSSLSKSPRCTFWNRIARARWQCLALEILFLLGDHLDSRSSKHRLDPVPKVRRSGVSGERHVHSSHGHTPETDRFGKHDSG